MFTVKRGYHISFLHFAQGNFADRTWRSDCPEVVLPFLYKSQVYTITTLRSSQILTRSPAKLKPDIVRASLTLSTISYQ